MEEITPVENQPNEPVDELLEPSVDAEPPSLEPVQKDTTPHPLSPGGKRFEQIYARSKQAERQVAELTERLARAEGQLTALTRTGTEEATADREYTWAELDQFIAQGRISRADAEAHREAVLEKRLAKKQEEKHEAATRTQTRAQQLDYQINSYLAAVPAVLEEGSPERQRLDEEFDWVASIQGVDPTKISALERKTLQAQALRNVYGPVDSLARKVAPMRTETHQGVSGGAAPARVKNPDQEILDKLTKAQVAHYRKMMNTGRYKNGWKDVVEELKFDPANRTRGGASGNMRKA